VTPENGGPVRADVITLEENHGPYAKGSQWAEPDVADAAAQMTRLCSDRALAARLGERARHTIETRFSPEAIGTRYRRRLESISGF
jgi:glycosyltransferase involved in cell wall biosynthesis